MEVPLFFMQWYMVSSKLEALQTCISITYENKNYLKVLTVLFHACKQSLTPYENGQF